MGLVDRVAEPGSALADTLELARQIAAHPQHCLRNDRRSTYEQWTLTTPEGLMNEFRLAQDSLASGSPADGLSRFTATQQ